MLESLQARSAQADTFEEQLKVATTAIQRLEDRIFQMTRELYLAKQKDVTDSNQELGEGGGGEVAFGCETPSSVKITNAS